MKCPKCKGTNLSAQKRGFGIGKALVGAAATGGVGLAAGFIGSNKIKVHCLKCGHKWDPTTQAKAEEAERKRIKRERSDARWAERKAQRK